MPAPGGLLSLDLSLTTGFAYGGLGERPIWGVWSLGKMARPGRCYAILEDEIDDAIKLHRPRAVVYEAPFSPQIMTNVEVGKLLLGLAAIVELICERHSIECFHQEVRQARSKVLGKNPTGGKDKVKPAIIAWCKSRGWSVFDQDDAADALLLLSYSTVILDKTGQAHFLKQGDKL